MRTTRTGGFPIGFRRGWSDWQKDLGSLLDWAKENELGVIDLGKSEADVAQAKAAGFQVGSADLFDWGGLISPDAGERRDSVAKNAEHAKKMVEAGATNLFCVMLPKDPSLSRKENFGFMADALGELCPQLDALGCQLAVEGWPGPGALCCTPEGYRAAIKEVGKGFGINFDPSHLLRMGIDPIRFVEEFAGSVAHVHGKDTEIMENALYEFGTEQPATFAEAYGFGAWHWRYTIPGHGRVRWTKAFQVLQDAGYTGAVSIELEDDAFNGSTEGEQRGILLGASYLEGV
ncbi:sugar phosphate isomerase/epimerase [soil metagenome]